MKREAELRAHDGVFRVKCCSCPIRPTTSRSSRAICSRKLGYYGAKGEKLVADVDLYWHCAAANWILG